MGSVAAPLVSPALVGGGGRVLKGGPAPRCSLGSQ